MKISSDAEPTFSFTSLARSVNSLKKINVKAAVAEMVITQCRRERARTKKENTNISPQENDGYTRQKRERERENAHTREHLTAR